MSYARFLSKKQLLTTMTFLVGLLLFIPIGASAQQQTGGVAPPTRNPQTNAPELFQQRDNIQSTSPQNLLNQQSKIKIPKGKRVNDNSGTARGTNIGRRLTLAVVSILGVLASFKLFKKSQEIEDSKKPAIKAAKTPDESKPAVADGVAPKKQSTKKKSKGKGKPRKKR